MKKTILIAAAILALAAPAAVTADEFRLTAVADYFGGIEPQAGYEHLRSRIFLRPWFSNTLPGTDIKWQLSANLWVQPIVGPDGVSGYAVAPGDILDEAWLSLPLGSFDLSVGQKPIAYGFADVFGPLNVVNAVNRVPLSLDEPFDNRLPSPLVQLQFYPDFDSVLELVYIPFMRPDRERLSDVFLTDLNDTVRWRDDMFILDNPHSFFVQYSRFGERVDLQLLYGWYTDQTPDFIRPSILTSASPYDIETVYRKRHIFGGAYAFKLGNGTFSQDIAFKLTDDLDGKDPGARNSEITVNTQYLANLPFGILSQFSVVYAHFINHGKHELQPGDEEAAIDSFAKAVQGFHTQPLQNIAFIVGHFERQFLRERLKAELNVGFFFSPEIYLAPRLNYHLSDHWSVAGGADINLGDPPDAALRRNPNDDNFYLRVVFRY
jgi:hypothetical protein